MKRMTKIVIEALNKKGHAAIKQHWDETKKLSLRNRMIFKTAGYKQQLESKDPFTLSLVMNNRHSKNYLFVDLIKGEIKKAFKQNGANEEDYKIEVVYDE